MYLRRPDCSEIHFQLFFPQKYFDGYGGEKKSFNDLPARAQGEVAMTNLHKLTREGE